MLILDYFLTDKLKTRARASYRLANRISKGTLAILVRAVSTFTQENAAEAATGIAYYTLFSLFPLLIFLITMASYVLERDEVITYVLDMVATTLPPAAELVEQNIQRILEQRDTMSIIAVIGLLWAATGVFAGLTRNINKAWHTATPSNFLHGRVVGLIIIVILTLLLILSIASTTFFQLLPRVDFNGPLWDEILLYETRTWRAVTQLVPWFFTFILCLGLYRWIPNTKVGWIEAIVGAVLAATAGEITKAGFAWFLSSGLAIYDVIYGSLGTIIVLMLAIYLMAVILLFCAHLSAAISYYRQQKR
jgi:membrane protein